MKSEAGQALPLAMLTLVIGALVVAPFLGHAGSSLIGARVYGEETAYQAAADAGIEHAIWGLTWGGLAAQFQQPGDTLTYTLAETINGATVTVTITANATPGGGVPGEIDDTTIDTMIFDASAGGYPDIINISGDVYAIAYRGPGNDGFVKTVTISPAGDIGVSVIDTLEFDPANGGYPDIVNISGDVYAIAYQGPGSDGFIKTVTISPAGDIGNSVIATLEFDQSNCSEPVIAPISGDVYAVFYRGPGNNGFVKTLSISPAGAIGGVIDTLEYDTSDGFYPDVIRISGDIFAIVYTGANADGFIITLAIAPDGNIAGAAADTFEYDGSDGAYPDIVNISGDIYGIAYTGTNNDGFLKTVTIGADGDITGVVDSLEFDAADGLEPRILNVAGDVYAIAYRGPGNDGFIKTVTISPAGDIGNNVIDTLEFDASDGYSPDIIRIAAGFYAIAYTGPSSSGYLKTFKIVTASATAAAYEIAASAGNRTIRAFVNTDNATSAIVSWQIE